jgi:hypothetical protein
MDSESLRWGAGNQSWVADQKKFFAAQLAAREAHLKKSAELCSKQDCSLGSPMWSTLSSSKIDGEIRQRTIYLLGGESKFPTAVVASLKAVSGETIYSSSEHNISFGFLLKNQPAMNASPLVSTAEQWGLTKKAMPIPAGESLYFDKWIYSSHEPRGILTLDREPIALPGQLILATAKSPVLLLKDSNGYKLYDLNSTEELPLAISLESNVEFDSGSDFVIQKIGENQTLVLRFAEKPLRILNQELLSGIFNVTPAYDNILFSKEGELIDLVSGLHLQAGAGVGMIRGTDKFILTENQAGEKKIFDRMTGAAITLSMEGQTTSAGADMRTILTIKGSETSLHFLDEKFNVRTVIRLKGYCNLQKENIIGCWESGAGGQSHFAVEKESVRKLDFGQHVRWVTDKWICRGQDEAKAQLFDRATGKLLISGARISALNDDLIGVAFAGDLFGSLVSVKNPAVPILSNVFSTGDWWWWATSLENNRGLWLSAGDGSVWLH